MLNVVDEKGNIVGEDSRENIHKRGLLHREIHVWYYTLKGEIIFQLRGKNKDTFPNQLDATVGGHVEIGEEYEDTAIKEMREETGVVASKKDLKEIKKVHRIAKDKVSGITNNALRKTYAYRYEGEIEDLVVEVDEGQGFEAWSIEVLLKGLEESDRDRFIPAMLSSEYLDIYRCIDKLVEINP